MNQRSLVVPKVDLKLLAASLRGDGLDYGFFRPSVMQVRKDTIADGEIVDVEVLFGFGLGAFWHRYLIDREQAEALPGVSCESKEIVSEDERRRCFANFARRRRF